MAIVMLSLPPHICKNLFRDGCNAVMMYDYPTEVTMPFVVLVYCNKGKDVLISVDHEGWNGEPLEKPLFVKRHEDGYYEMDVGKVIGMLRCNRLSKLDKDCPAHHKLIAGEFQTEDDGNPRYAETEKEFVKNIKRNNRYVWHFDKKEHFDISMTVEECGLKAAPRKKWRYL